MLEVERAALYVAFVAALVFVAGSAEQLLRGLLAATLLLSAWAQLEHLLIERDVDAFQGALLTGSVDYANALGALAAIGGVCAAGLGADRRERWPYIAAAQVLLCTVALTNSRGAAVALVVGVVVATSLSRARLRLGVLFGLLVIGALVVGYVAATTGVTRGQTGSSQVVWEARGVLVLVLAAAVGAALVARALPKQLRPPSRSVLLGGSAALASAAVVVLVFVSPDLGDRREYWQVASDGFGERPVLGHGPGTFERLWLERRPVEREARDAHSLYLETLTEQGIVGGLLLVAVLALPIVGVVRHGRGAVAAAAGGAYVTYLAHAGLDWDWEMPAVTAAGLLAGVAGVTLARTGAAQPLAGRERLAAAGMLAIIFAGSVYALAGNWRVTEARDALAGGRPASAFASATRAGSLQPWSSEPLILDAQSRLVLGDSRGARDRLVEAVGRDPTVWLGWWLLALSSDRAEERALAAREAARLNPLFGPLP